MEKIYSIQRNSDFSFAFTTDNQFNYEIIFEESKRHYKDICQNCHRIFEVNWLCNEDNPCRDIKTGKTVVEIFKIFLAEDFNDGVVYRIYNKPEKKNNKIVKRGNLRELLFNKLISKYLDDDFQKLCNDPFIKNPDEKLCLIVNRNSPTYHKDVQDLTIDCLACQKQIQEDIC